MIWACLYLPNLGVPAFSGMEGLRYSVAKEMLVHQDWLHLYLNGDPYLNKPPLTMWLIAPTITRLDQINEFSARLPFALSMLVMALVSFAIFARWVPRGRATIIALLPLTTIGAVRFGRACEIDGLFAVFFVLAVILWCDIWLSQSFRPKSSLVMGLAIGLGGLCKGPLIIAMVGLFCGLVALRARYWRYIPISAFAIGITIPLVWVAILGRSGLGHAALATWSHEVAMRFDPHVVPASEPPWLVQMMWAFIMTLPWSLLYPLLYWPRLLPDDRIVGALLRGGRDAGALSFLAIIFWPGLQYQCFVPIGLLMALEIGLAVAMLPAASSPQLARALRLVGLTLALLLGLTSTMIAASAETLVAGLTGVTGLVVSITLIRPLASRIDVLAGTRRALAGMIAITAIMVVIAIPPLNGSAQDRDIGLRLRAVVPAGEKVFCPFSIDNLATYIERPVLIYVPELRQDHLYAILREADVASLRGSPSLTVADLVPFRYLSGWRRLPEQLHLVRLTTRDVGQFVKPADIRGHLQS
jgi:4-amino-4-deoxy-L-arabinose transferase-like glycosyltransferase